MSEAQRRLAQLLYAGDAVGRREMALAQHEGTPSRRYAEPSRTPPPAPSEPTPIRDPLVMGALDTMSAGWADEGFGLLASAMDIPDYRHPARTMTPEGMTNAVRKKFASAQESNPAMFAVGQGAGMLPYAGLLGLPAGSLGPRTARSARDMGVYGAIWGAGRDDEDRMKGALSGGVAGAAGGALAGASAPYLAPLLSKMMPHYVSPAQAAFQGVGAAYDGGGWDALESLVQGVYE